MRRPKSKKQPLHYHSPKDTDKEYWVPVVVKNKDYLVGYIHGMNMLQDIVVEGLKQAGVDLGGLDIDLCLDSTRFNDVLENGVRESELTREQLQEYYENTVKEKFECAQEKHPDNDPKVFGNEFIKVECPCGLGIYTFKRPQSLPETNVKCSICGRTIIDYTGHDDFEYEYTEKRRNS